RAALSSSATTAPPCTMPGQLWSTRDTLSPRRPSAEGRTAASMASAIVSTAASGGREQLAILGASHGVGGHSSLRANPLATRLIASLLSMISGRFAQAMLGAFFFFGSLNGFVLLPLYVHSLGGNEASIGLVQGMYSATGIVCQPLVGAWIDRLGRRTFMLLGTSVLTVATAAFLVVSSMPGLAALRAVHGVAFSAFFVANYLYLVDLVPAERRGWALGIFGLSGLISTSLAPLFGEFLARHWGFRLLFVFSTLLAVAATAVTERMRDVRPPSLGVGTTL